jgi:hypothetical protein
MALDWQRPAKEDDMQEEAYCPLGCLDGADSPYPPNYIKLSPDIACADVEDSLIVTMARILGLCWNNRYRRYTPDQLAETATYSRFGGDVSSLNKQLNRHRSLAPLSGKKSPAPCGRGSSFFVMGFSSRRSCSTELMSMP